ncbi:MAG: hypothetical protein CL583_19395 [Alteromonadaceae bacterium]|nr:hypothetical protein [Alteromonadaceae bacterium]|tara:strand:+ start:8232 stop:9425 length:1194 start_codon:yes stop_codon:yes gene_type:complete
MVLNPFHILFLLYLLANAIALVQGIVDGGMVLEYQFFAISSSVFIASFVVQFVFLLAMLVMFHVGRGMRHCSSPLSLGPEWGYLLIVLQVSFAIFNSYMAVNIAGTGARLDESSLLNYVFIVFQPDLLFIIIAISLRSSLLFHINVLIFLISMLLRGWMGGVFIVFIIYIIRYYPVRLSVNSTVKLLGVAFLILASLPFILEAKWAVRGGASILDVLMRAQDIMTYDNYLTAFSYLVNRFQHVGHVALLLERSDLLKNLYLDGAFSSYWLDGLPQYAAIKVFGGEFHSLNSFMVHYIFGVSGASWNTNPGIAGWFFILREHSVFLILYLLLFLTLPFYFAVRYGGARVSLLLACFSLLYLFHGWFGAYFNLMSYSVAFVFLHRVSVSNKNTPLTRDS